MRGLGNADAVHKHTNGCWIVWTGHAAPRAHRCRTTVWLGGVGGGLPRGAAAHRRWFTALPPELSDRSEVANVLLVIY